MSQIAQGDVVRIHYTGRFEDGQVFDTSADRDPLEFVAGGPQVIPGVSNAVVGMEEGEKKTVTLSPEDGYGQRNPALEQTIARNQLPEEVNVGDQLRAVQGEQETAVWIRELNDETALIDANHPLAGRALTFEVELVSVASEGKG